jgi:hypothetical protein
MRPAPVAVGLAAVADDPGQQLRVGHRQVGAEHPPEAGAQLVERHRGGQVRRRVFLPGVDDVRAARCALVEERERPERVDAVRGGDLRHQPQLADPGYLRLAAAQADLRRRDEDPADARHLGRGDAGEPDPGLLPDQAVRPVAAHQVPGAEPGVAVRAQHQRPE